MGPRIFLSLTREKESEGFAICKNYRIFAPDFPPEVRCGVGAESQGSLKREEK